MKLLGTGSRPGLVVRVLTVSGLVGLSLFVVDCLDTRSNTTQRDAGGDVTDGGPDADSAAEVVPVDVTVSVDVTADRAVVAPNHFGMHSSVYDNALHNPTLPSLLGESGVTLLRYPGGGYSDNYHWSTHSMTPGADGSVGYLANASDFGSYVGVIDSFGGSIMITVNYGSNLQGDGPGEPKEAAAWVAYANGDPGNDYEIGVDGAGNDWKTVGYWAGLRASAALATDDGRNFLRIEHPLPLGIQYWEIGNEVFGNGFHEKNGTAGFELDWHVPYPTPNDDPSAAEFARFGNDVLSGTTYGEGVRAYVEEMKAVDSSIKVGAVLGTPPADDSWMTAVPGYYWNDDVLAACGTVIDFGIVHWYPNPPAKAQENDPNANTIFRIAGLLTYPRNVMPVMVNTLHALFDEHCGDNAANVEMVMTEVGTGVNVPRGRNGGLNRGQAMGIFAADMYLSAAEQGFVNVDWLELHNGTFLNEAMPPVEGPAFNGIRMAHLLAGPGDHLVTATTDTPSLVVHAARREDGKIGVLLINTQGPELRPARVTLSFAGAPVGASGERYDYAPPEVDVDGGMDAGADADVDAAAAAAAAALLRAGASGTVIGPTPFSGLESPFTVELPQYGVAVLLFDAN